MPQKMCLKQKAIKIKYKRMLQEIKMSYLLSIHEDSGGELHPCSRLAAALEISHSEKRA